MTARSGSARARRVATMAMALGTGLATSQLFVAWPWRAGIALGIALALGGAVELADQRAAQAFRSYGEGWYDGRHQALREVAERLDDRVPANTALLAYIEAEAPADAPHVGAGALEAVR